MDLFVWPQRWNMGSFDPDSLAVLAYVRFGGLPVNVRTDFCAFRAPEGGVPYVVQGLNVASGVNQIFEYFRKENYGIEYQLEGQDLVRLNALMRFVETELKPAVYHLFFINSANFTQEVRKAYCEAVGFPTSLLIASRLQKTAEVRVKKSHLSCDRLNDEQLQKEIYNQGKIALTSLSYLLNDDTYFIGDKPTAIDALVFGFLMPLLKAPLPQHPLLHHLRQCDNLTNFCFRVQNRFFAELPPTPGSNESNEAGDISGLAPALSFKGIRNALLFGATAAAASLFFAVHNGMLEVGMSEATPEEKEEERMTITD